MCSACDTAHVNSVCAFSCPMPLWPERVVVIGFYCQGFLKMCHTVVGGICVSILVLHKDFFGLCKIFLRSRSSVSSDVFGRPDPLLVHKQPSSLNFLCHVKICIAVGGCFENYLANACYTVCSTVIEHTPTHKTPFLFQ